MPSDTAIKNNPKVEGPGFLLQKIFHCREIEIMTPSQVWQEMRWLSVKMPWWIVGKWGSCSFLLIIVWISSFHFQFRQDIADIVCLCVWCLMKLPSPIFYLHGHAWQESQYLLNTFYKNTLFLTSLVLGTKSSGDPFHLFSSCLYNRFSCLSRYLRWMYPCDRVCSGHDTVFSCVSELHLLDTSKGREEEDRDVGRISTTTFSLGLQATNKLMYEKAISHMCAIYLKGTFGCDILNYY